MTKHQGEGGHTPGPWSWIVSDDGQTTALRYRHPEGGGSYVLTPEAVSDDDRVCVETSCDVSPADARLIAAAPDLLEALKALIGAVEGPDETGGPNWTERVQAKINAARAAIAKATHPESRGESCDANKEEGR